MSDSNASNTAWLASYKLAGLLFVYLIVSPVISGAKAIKVSPGEGVLQLAIDKAVRGDVINLQQGVYSGRITISKPLSIIGDGESVINGDASGHVITVDAPDVVIEKVRIEHSGNDLETEDSGIYITDKGDNVRIDNCDLENNLIGINLKGPEEAIIRNSRITGGRHHRVNDRGNAVHIWNSTGSTVENNDIRYGRDGIYVTNSKNNRFYANTMRDLRFAVHYMYTQNSVVSNNVSINNHVGFALMFSDRVSARDNLSINDHQRGLFFNFANYSVVEGNRVMGGPEKCVFIYNANYNQIRNNRFEKCDIGIHFTAGSDKNSIYGNAFINNRTQVKYVGTRHIEWSKDGVGNYWSDNVAFDLDKNMIADMAYKPNDLVDQIVWRHPMAKLLLNSPSMQLLKWAQSEFPGLHPGGVIDSSPLMVAPVPAVKIDELHRESASNG